LVRLEQPRRFHGLVYINALTLSTVLFVLAAQLLLALPESQSSTASAALQTTTVSATQTEPAIPTELPATNQLSISATVRPTPRRVLPDCSSAPYQLPSQLAGQDLAAGVHVSPDTSVTYPVYGDTTADLEQDIARCSPIATSEGRFAATTGYALATYYRYAGTAQGTCRVTSAVVTLHINQTFPQWQDKPTADSQTRVAWNNFIANLHTHEQGHIELDQAAAQNLFAQLTNLEAPNCSALQTIVSATTSSIINNLRIANDQYDDTTKHGTTQGAVL
jgi:predicted secreted Zn-dependent protease